MTLVIVLSGCYKDIIIPEMASGPDDLPPKQVSYTGELAPMFNSNCAVAGCHVTGAHKPYLYTDISYGEIVNGGLPEPGYCQRKVSSIKYLPERWQNTYLPR